MSKRKFWNWLEGENERILRIDGIIAEEPWINDDITPKQFQSELTSGDGNVSLWITLQVEMSWQRVRYTIF